MIFLISIPLIVFTIVLSDDGISSYGRYIGVNLSSITAILLNLKRQYLLSKILTATIPLFFVVVYPIYFMNFFHTGMFLWIPYAIMTFGIIPFFIFSIKQEKIIMIILILIHLVFVFGFDELLMFHFSSSPDMFFVKKYYLYYLLSKTFIVLFLYSTFFIFKYQSFRNRMHLLELSNELNKKNIDLMIFTEKLETIIKERTTQIQNQNQRIKNISYTNAHEIRNYIVRIIGLMNVLKYEISPEEKEYCETKIRENIDQLDQTTKELSKELQEEEEV